MTSRTHEDQVDYDQRLIADVRGGRYAMAKVGARAFDLDGVTSFRPPVAPLVVTTYTLQKRVLEAPLADHMLAGVRRLGLVGVALLPGDLRHPLGLTHPLGRPADFAGLRFGTRPSGVGDDTVRALGADPVGWVKSGRLHGLDALDLDALATAGNEYARRATAITTNLVLWPRAQALVINQRAYRTLTASQRDVLRRAAAAAIAPALARLTTTDRDALSYLCSHGLELARATPADLTAMQQAVAPVIAGLRRDADNRKTLAQIHALARGTDHGESQTPPCNRPSPRPPPARANHELTGTWRADVTHRRYLAAHPDPDEEPTNWGPQTLKLTTDGKFSYTNQRIPGELAGLGTYTTYGQELDFHAGGTYDQGNGQTWRFRWSLYRDALTFRRIGTGPSPTVFIAAAWHRVRQ